MHYKGATKEMGAPVPVRTPRKALRSEQTRPGASSAPQTLTDTQVTWGAVDYQILIQKVWGQDTCSKLPRGADSTGVG